MFEKEAEEYRESKRHKSFRADVGTIQINYESYLNNLQSAFKDGAEFGYNKADEWHYLKDGDLPKENKLYFVVMKDNGLAIAYFNGLHWETRYNLGDFGHCVETVIAWKEIVLPKERA